jgi:hypothetical protein
MQEKEPVDFYLQKLNTAQKRYITTEREFLLAIETIKENKNIHKNNNFIGLKASDCVLLWLLLLAEYGVTFEYLPGKKNVGAVADA